MVFFKKAHTEQPSSALFLYWYIEISIQIGGCQHVEISFFEKCIKELIE